MNVNLTYSEIKGAIAAVKRGIDILNGHFGENVWVDDIDLDKLNMDNALYCILGQLFGDYGSGRFTLGIQNENGSYYGFDNMFREDEGWGVLNELWASYITQVPLTINDIEVKW